MGNLGTLILIIVIVSSVIRSIMQAAERLKRENTQTGGTPPTGAPSPATGSDPQSRPSAPAATSATSRAEELAARRKAQLEELRRRRAGGTSKTQPAATTARVGAPQAAPSISAPTAPVGGMASFTSASPLPDRSRELAEARQRKLQHQQAHLKQEALERQREALEQVQARARAKARTRRDAATVESAIAATKRSTSSIATVVRARFRNPAQLRELIVMRELLDPPVSMREPQQFPYGD